MSKIDNIENLLPQTQCGLCDYPGCRPYAEAIANNNAAINKCLPGGLNVLKALAVELGRELDTATITQMQQNYRPIKVAKIDEARCIGCAKCLKPCPTDAIVGSNKFMHSIIEFDCTGCEKCIPACPVDCIDMQDRDAITVTQQTHWQQLHTKQIERSGSLDKHRAIGKHKQVDNAELSQDQHKQLILDAIARKKNK
jgi:Na+-translocating ferredoxin:NAD+ oxidoreductase subunit B